ncbi:WxL domain-containing protein [Companilactobacillus nantensis]|uniref:WxL domain-containing protein n=1 Tax=Companilactobacillus nantensis DSM 16982 TaxID=1423774 RepID=A0A0R1WHB5_9LACO|nr:WxL domain-containing protein [Companilactobacillus nantensis]KRM17151.1 hypothetical protein FD31_GL000396 [Companilactobacillus nantensis DSM 16982]GEO64088.1 hypothetical protein LNA01_12710 [Companilactobacillus nantensis]
MKLSRNVLVGSLAVSGMVLGAIAPAMTAQAATSTGVIGSDGTVTHTDTPQNIGDLNNPENGQLAIAMDKTEGDGSGVATATSNAAVKVVTGVLVLDQVPDFNFGTAVSGQQKDLVDNTRPADAKSVDGNADGNLSVLESRDVTKTNGFTLTAQLGQFTDANGNPVSGDGAFTLNLLSQPVSNGKETITDDSGNQLTTQAAALKSSTTTPSSVGAAADVMTIDNKSTAYKAGQYLAKFNSASTSADKKAGANLVIPNISDHSAAVKSLNAPITWTLKTNAVQGA